MSSHDGHERSRKILSLAAVMWCAAIVALIIGMRTRVKPILIVGIVDALIALGLTQFWLRASLRR